jgi:hypothetical protein
MDMVLRSADGKGNDFMVPANPAKVGPQSRLPFFWDGIAAVLRAENEMDMNL